MKKFIYAYDSKIDHLLNKFTRLWSRVTGKSNFVLALATLAIGISLVTVGGMAQYIMEGNGLWIGIHVMIVPIWLWIGKRRWVFYKQVERSVQNSTDGTLNLNLFELHSVATDRLLWNVLCVMLLPGAVLLRPISLGMVFYAASMHFVFHLDCPGGKSVFAKVKDKAKAAIERAKDFVPDLAPRPVPVPIGVR